MNEQSPDLIPPHQDAATDALSGVVVPLLDSYTIVGDRQYFVVRAVNLHGEPDQRGEEVRGVGFRPVKFHAGDATRALGQNEAAA